MAKNIEYKLIDELKYPDRGDMIYAKKLCFTAPTRRCGSAPALISQTIMRAMSSLNQNDQAQANAEVQDDDNSIDGSAILMMLQMSKDVDYAKLLDLFVDLFCIIGTIDGEKRITSHLLEDLSYADMIGACEVYVSSFFIPKLLK